MRLQSMAAVMALGLAAGPCKAQTTPTQMASLVASGPALRSGSTGIGTSAGTGIRPFSMVQTETVEQTFGDGLVLTSKVIVKTSRDSQGRMRIEREMPTRHPFALSAQALPDEVRFWSVALIDPSLHGTMYWTTMPGTPREVRLSRSSDTPRTDLIPWPDGQSEDVAVKPLNRHEELGERSVQGMALTGSRTTVTFPVGSDGNNLEFTATSESWLSLDYGQMLESVSSDPRGGKRTVKLVSFNTDEPDASLFAAPADYKLLGMEKQ